MKLTKFLLPIALLFGVVFFTPTDTYRTYAEESTSEVTSEVTEENQFEEKTYTYTCDEGSVIFTLISETEVYGKITTAEGEVLEGTASYSIEDNVITITKTDEEPIQFTIDGEILTPLEETIEQEITFLEWVIENENLITLILTAIVVIMSGLAERIMSSKSIKNTLTNANIKVDDMSTKTNESSKRLEKNVTDLTTFVKNNLGDIVDVVKKLTVEDKEFKESITKVISEIKTEQNQISKVYGDIENIKKSIRIAFCNDKQYYKDGRAQAIEKLLGEESGD